MVILVCITWQEGIKISGFLIYACLNFMSHPDINYFEPAYCADLCYVLYIEKSIVCKKNEGKSPKLLIPFLNMIYIKYFGIILRQCISIINQEKYPDEMLSSSVFIDH